MRNLRLKQKYFILKITILTELDIIDLHRTLCLRSYLQNLSTFKITNDVCSNKFQRGDVVRFVVSNHNQLNKESDTFLKS